MADEKLEFRHADTEKTVVDEKPHFGHTDTGNTITADEKLAKDALKRDSSSDGKEPGVLEEAVPAYESSDGLVISTAEDITTHVLHVDDDPTLNPWTFRMFFLGTSTSRAD